MFSLTLYANYYTFNKHVALFTSDNEISLPVNIEDLPIVKSEKGKHETGNNLMGFPFEGFMHSQ